MLDRRRIRDSRGHHPWKLMGLLPDWDVRFTLDLPVDKNGLTVHADRVVLVRDGLDVAARRSTICHEAGHVLRGPFASAHELYEESLVDRQAARLLMPSVTKIGYALAAHAGDYAQAARDLWVDERLLNTRLSTLEPKERRDFDDHLATIFL